MDAIEEQFSSSNLKAGSHRGRGIWAGIGAHLKFMDDTQLLQRQTAEESDSEVVRL